MKAILIREYKPKVTKGNLYLFNDTDLMVSSLKTVELPWLNNRTQMSCISEGKYDVVIRKAEESANFNYTHFHIKDVPGRTWILFHVANYVRQLKGCIGPGLTHRDIDRDGIIDVTDSRLALDSMLRIAPNGFKLIITSHDRNIFPIR